MSGEDYSGPLPGRVNAHFGLQEVLELGLQSHHEFSSRSNAVRVEPFSVKLLGLLITLGFLELALGLRSCVLSRPEASGALLVHLCPGGDAVHGEEEQPARAHHSNERLQIMEDAFKDFRLRDAVVVVVIWMGTVVDDAVHVQVEVVKLGNLKITGRVSYRI